MKTLLRLAATLGFLITALPAQANETFEIYADSTMSGNAGSLMNISEPGFPTETAFLFEELGKVRVFAFREAGIPGWDIPSFAMYLCQSQTMAIGNSWRFLDDDGDVEILATVAALENVTTAAGNFSAYRVDMSATSEPGVVRESIWFASGVGIVRFEEYVNGVLDWKSDLNNFTVVGGSGFFPRAVGNTWVYFDINVAVANSSWSAVKGLFQ